MKLSKFSIKSLNIYGYAVNVVIYAGVANYLEISKVSVYKATIKNKSNRQEIRQFIEGLVSSITYLLETKTKFLKAGSFLIQFAFNENINFDFDVNNFYGAFGCLASAVLQNNLYFTRVSIKVILDEMTSTTLATVLNNDITISYLHLESSMASFKAMDFIYSNKITIENSTFWDNRASGASSSFDFEIYSTAGSLGLILSNTLFMINTSFIKGKSSIRGGAISGKMLNKIILDNCSFIENESSNQESTGGAIDIEFFNFLNVSNSNFINNYGTYGGVFHAFDENIINFQDCVYS
jgi:hypothetical protein